MLPIMSSLLLDAIERRDNPAVLRYARDRAELSQTELAHWLGFHPSVVSRMEAGHRRMDKRGHPAAPGRRPAVTRGGVRTRGPRKRGARASRPEGF